jgi:hypothetical protein
MWGGALARDSALGCSVHSSKTSAIKPFSSVMSRVCHSRVSQAQAQAHIDLDLA